MGVTENILQSFTFALNQVSLSIDTAKVHIIIEKNEGFMLKVIHTYVNCC